MLLDTYAPLRRINKYRLKFNSKPWTNLGSLANYITKKDPILKEEFLTKCKKIQIYSPPLWRELNRLITINIFKQIWNNIKNTWKEIRSPISLKTVTSNLPTVPSLDNGDIITNHFDIANTLVVTMILYLKLQEKANYIHIKILQAILLMKMVGQYFCNPLIKKR